MPLTSKYPDNDEDNNSFTGFELELVITTINKCCGQSFDGYSPRSIRRLVEGIMHDEQLKYISLLIPKILYDIAFQEKIVDKMTVSYSQLFRDPSLFSKLKQDVLPQLATYPRISLWVAGCATGEEAYSLAILLDEAGLLEQSQIYASDISSQALKSAASGKLDSALTEQDEMRYQQSGGTKSLKYYFDNENGNRLCQRLMSHIVFERHDLANQSSFLSAQLVLCRNVFIYFERELQNRVLLLLLDSTTNRGYVAVGIEENISFCNNSSSLELISRKAGLYRKRFSKNIPSDI